MYYQNRRLNFNDTVVYTRGFPSPAYPEAPIQEDGTFEGKIVDFTNETTIGVRADRFNGNAPLYYVSIFDIIEIREELN